MGKTYEALDHKLTAFIEAQKMFFIATAPLSGDGRLNLSPKGFETLRILDSRTLAYLDLTGSGVETIAHLKENQRFVLMFCSFESKPMSCAFTAAARLWSKATKNSNGSCRCSPTFSALARSSSYRWGASPTRADGACRCTSTGASAIRTAATPPRRASTAYEKASSPATWPVSTDCQH